MAGGSFWPCLSQDLLPNSASSPNLNNASGRTIYLDILQSTASSPFPRAISNPPQLQPIEPISTIDCRAYCYNPPIPIPVVVVVVKMFLPCTYDPPCPQSLQNTFFCSHLSCTNLLHDFPRWVLDGWGLYEVTRNINYVGKFIVGLIVGKSHRMSSDFFIRFAQ